MDKELGGYEKTIARLDLRIDRLLKMRKNIILDMMYLIISEEEKKTTIEQIGTIAFRQSKELQNLFDAGKIKTLDKQ